VEQTIGILKSRWRCLDGHNNGGMQFRPETCCKIVGACVVLHNYCARRRNPELDIEVMPHLACEINEHVGVNPSDTVTSDLILRRLGKEMRREIVLRYFH
jgi:hypothetical protein